MDGYRIPGRISVHLLDTPCIFGVDECQLLMGIDSLKKVLGPTGGTVEPGEFLEQAGLAEDKEEAGPERDPIPVHSTIPTFSTYECNGLVANLALDDDLENEIALRNFIRTKSTVIPQQQPAKPGELYPELIRPKYMMVLPADIRFRLMRPSYAHAIRLAYQKRMLYSVTGRKRVALDYQQLAREWQAMRIHPEIISFYCRPSPLGNLKLNWQEKLGILPPSMSALMENLKASEAKLHNMLTVPDPGTEKLLEQPNF